MAEVTLVLAIPVGKHGSGDGGGLFGEVRCSIVVPVLSRLRDYIPDLPPRSGLLGYEAEMGKEQWYEECRRQEWDPIRS